MQASVYPTLGARFIAELSKLVPNKRFLPRGNAPNRAPNVSEGSGPSTPANTNEPSTTVSPKRTPNVSDGPA